MGRRFCPAVFSFDVRREQWTRWNEKEKVVKDMVPITIYGSHVDVTEGVILGHLSLHEGAGFGATCLDCQDGIAEGEAVPVLGTASAYVLPDEVAFRCSECASGVPREDSEEDEDRDGPDEGLSF